MSFLLRLTFWLGLVLVLLPRDKTPESDKLPQIDASQAVQAATAAVSDMSQFCRRQPTACEVGGQAATMIGARAQEGARKLYKIITDKKPDSDKKSPEADKKPPDHTDSICRCWLRTVTIRRYGFRRAPAWKICAPPPKCCGTPIARPCPQLKPAHLTRQS